MKSTAKPKGYKVNINALKEWCSMKKVVLRNFTKFTGISRNF